jgi:hypothetical protein
LQRNKNNGSATCRVFVGNGSGYTTDRNIDACRLLRKDILFSATLPPGLRLCNCKNDFLETVLNCYFFVLASACVCYNGDKRGDTVITAGLKQVRISTVLC